MWPNIMLHWFSAESLFSCFVFCPMISSTISYTDLPAMAATSHGSHGKCAFVVPHVLPPKLCRELWFQHLTCGVPGYRPGLNVWWSLVVGWRLWCDKCVYLLCFFCKAKLECVILGVTNGRKSNMLGGVLCPWWTTWGYSVVGRDGKPTSCR